MRIVRSVLLACRRPERCKTNLRRVVGHATTAVGAIWALCTGSSCGMVFGYPDTVAEASSALCADGTDNDFDGRIDCDDPSCDGFCAEQGADSCADGRDNDGDGLIDGADPRCWVAASPAVTRCASWDPVRLEERFDSVLSLARWHLFGVLTDGTTPVAERQLPANRDDRRDFVLGFSTKGPAEGVLGGIVSIPMFDGDWRGFELTFQAQLTTGGLARIGWVPANLAKAGESPVMNASASALLVELDGSDTPAVALLVHEQRVAADWPSPETWHAVRLASSEEELKLEVDGVEVARAPLPTIPPSRLVLWGESKTLVGTQSAVQLDDIRLRFAGRRPCGAVSPQIPFGATCRDDAAKRAEDVGLTVSTARGAGTVCALVTSAPAGSGKATAAQQWSSPDGLAWTSGGQWQASGLGTITGAALAFDAASQSFRAVVAETTGTEVQLRVASSPDCVTWGDLQDAGTLPSDAEAPSYVLPGVEAGHELYFTRPPSYNAKARTLWRVGSEDGRFDAEAELVAPLPDTAYVAAPFAVSRAGARDIVAVYPLSADAPAQGLGLLIATDDSLAMWEPASAWPLLSAESARGGFDSDAIVSGSVVWSGDQGLVLYGARGWALPLESEGGGPAPLTVGTAKLALGSEEKPSPVDSPATPDCGNGTCEAAESCSSCAIDCDICDGELVLADRFDSSDAWSVQVPPGVSTVSSALASASFRISPAHHELLVNPTVPGWLGRALPAPLTGDFELSFDVHVVPPSSDEADSCPLMVGVGDGAPNAAVDPEGVFVRIDSHSPCSPGAPGFSPRVNRKVQGWEPPDTASAPAEHVDCENVIAGAVERWHHVTLTRHDSSVTVRMRDRDGCEEAGDQELTVEYTGALDSPTFLLAGYPGVMGRSGWDAPCAAREQSISVENLVLRKLPCAAERSPCAEPDTGASGCVDLRSSNEHCGACFAAVRDAEVCEGGEAVCKGALCTDEVSGLEMCTDLATDPNHCGACGNQLTAHEVCVGGMRLARMVQLPEGFWIDSTEVTRAQYAAWLATEPSTALQPPACSQWHTSFTPVCAWPPGDRPNNPVVCVGWCDGYAYCESVGKRMCGAVGGGTLAAVSADYASTKSQWTVACTSGKKHSYPYGDTYDPNACYGRQNPLVTCITEGSSNFCEMGEAGSLESCQSQESGYEGVYDLVFNGWEAIDACSATSGKDDLCVGLGSAADGGPNDSCGSAVKVSRNYPDGHRALRCCAW